MTEPMAARASVLVLLLIAFVTSACSSQPDQAEQARSQARTTGNSSSGIRVLSEREWEQRLKSTPIRSCGDFGTAVDPVSAAAVNFSQAPCTGEQIIIGDDPLGMTFVGARSLSLTEGILTFIDLDEGGGGNHPAYVTHVFRQWADGHEGAIAVLARRPDAVQLTTTGLQIRFRDGLHRGEDPRCCPSVWVTSVFSGDAAGVKLTERNTEFVEDTSVATSLGRLKPQVSDAVTEITRIALNPSLTQVQRDTQYRVLQRSLGEELFATALRLVPVYDDRSREFRSFDNVAREMVSSAAGGEPASPLERDPVGATLRLVFDPSVETIQGMLGIR